MLNRFEPPSLPKILAMPLGGPLIVLPSRGISQICHTYSEDIHPIYPPLPWLLRGRAEDKWVHFLLLSVVYPILDQKPPLK